MKTKRIIAIILFGMICFMGCGASKKEEKQNRAEQKEEEYEMQVYRTPTERELEILEDCNLSSDYMKEIKEKGMSVSVQSFVDTAQIMLDYLEEKYDEEFKVLGGEIPGVISGDYSIIAYATEGEYAGEEFDVYYRVDEEGNGYCEDGYFAILKNEEFQEMMQKRADETGEGWKVFTELSGTYGKEYGTDTNISDIRPEDIYADLNCIMTPQKSDEEYAKSLDKLRGEYKQEEYNMRIYYCHFLDLKDWKKINSYKSSNDIIREQTEGEQIYTDALFE